MIPENLYQHFQCDSCSQGPHIGPCHVKFYILWPTILSLDLSGLYFGLFASMRPDYS